MFDGQPVADGDVIVRFTYYGDANLDGVVNSTDETAMENGETNNLTGWNNGDFDYSGVIDDNDAALLDASESFDLAAPLPPAAENQLYSFTLPGDAIEANTEMSTIQNWLIRWGDGSSTNYAVPAGSSPDVVASHTYASPNIGEYSLAIVASGSSGYGSRSHIYTLVLPHEDVVVAPDAPTNLSATESNAGEVDLAWDDGSQLPTGYTVTATPTAGGTTITQNYNSSRFTAAVTGLTADENYTFNVVADNTLSDGITAQSALTTVAAMPSASILSATGPTNVAEGTTGMTLNLSSGSSSTIARWEVVWSDQDGNTLADDTITGSGGSDAFPSPMPLQLTAVVTATDSLVNSFTLPTFTSVLVPNAPTGLTVTAASGSEIDLSWVDHSSISTEDFVYASTDGGTTFDPIDQATPAASGSDNTYAATGLTSGVPYQFYVTADTDYAESLAANIVSGSTPFVAPATPTGLSAMEPRAGEVDLSWTDDATIATGYIVTATPTAGGSTITQNVDAYTSASIFTGLTADVDYTFSVTAVNTLANGDTLESSPATLAVAAPTNSLVITGPGTINEGSTGNILTLSSGTGSNITSWQVIWTDQNGATLATDTITGAGGSCAFPSSTTPVLFAAVTAYDSAGATFILPTFESDVIPTAPSNVQATMASSTEIEITWTNNSAIASGFEILRSLYGGAFVDIGSVAAGVTSFADTGLDPSDSAAYEVVASGAAAAKTAVSSTSAASATATTATGMPTLAATTDPADAAIQLTWTFVGDNDYGFELEAEDTTIGENFHTISVSGPVSPSTPGGIGYDQYSFGVTPGDNYNFRIRVDYTDGTVSDYVSASASIALAPAPAFHAYVLEYSYAPYEQYIQVAWGTTVNDSGVNIEVSGNDFAGPGWRSAVDGDNSGDFGGSSGSPPDGFEGCVDNPGVDVTFGGDYSFRIRSFDQYGNPTAWSAPQSASLGGSSAGPTMSFTPGSTSIAVSWTVSDPTMNSFLYMATSADGVVAQQERPVYTATGSSTAPTSYTATVSNLIPGTQYYFNLKTALPSNGYSIPTTTYYMSNGSSATTGTAPVAPPAAPAFAHAIYDPSTDPGQVKLSWANTPNNETGYTIDRMIPIVTGGYTLIFIANTNADVTTYTDRILGDNGPYIFRIYSRNSAGESTTFASANCVAIGGPDITAHLIAIRKYMLKIAAIPDGYNTLDKGYFSSIEDQKQNWDIDLLALQQVSLPTNRGGLPDGSHTVTVAGHVYIQADVNYWLYGIWVSIVGPNLADKQIGLSKVVYHGTQTIEGPKGKAAWYNAGFAADMGIPVPTAIPNVAPGNRPSDLYGPQLNWFVGIPPNQINGSN